MLAGVSIWKIRIVAKSYTRIVSQLHCEMLKKMAEGLAYIETGLSLIISI